MKELNNTLIYYLKRRPGDTQERLNKLSVTVQCKEQLQYSIRSKNIFSVVSKMYKN